MLLLGGLAQTALQAQAAYFSGAVTSLGGGDFYYTYGVAVDQSGNVYVADEGHNSVKEMPPGCMSQSCVTTLGGNWDAPKGVAVDASGNVYVADSLHDEIEEMSPGCTPDVYSSAGCTIESLGGGFSEPFGVAVDKSGNIYVADTGNGVVTEMPAGCASSNCVTTLGGLGVPMSPGVPIGVAVDSSGNVYVGDVSYGLYEMPPGCTQTKFQAQVCSATKLGGGILAAGVAVDGSGNIYAANTDASAVNEMPPGCTSASCVTALGGGFGSPTGIAVDLNGNVYVGIQSNPAVQEISPHGVSFGTVPVGSTGPTLTLYFTFKAIDSSISATVVTQGAKGLDFIDAGTGTCDTNGTSYTYIAYPPESNYSSFNCSVTVTFAPKYAGSRYGAVQLSDATGVIATAYIYGTGQGPQIAFGPPAQTTIGGFFSFPEGVGVDGSGNVYVADYNNNAVKTIVAGCASASCVTSLGGGFFEPVYLAVDGAGNVYVADWGNNAVKQIPAGCIYSSCVLTLGGGFINPGGVAVDSSGNVYIGDNGNNAVKEMPPGCTSASCVAILGGGFSNPLGVAVDGGGNVYVADSGNNAVKEMPPGCSSSSCAMTLGGGFAGPYSVAVDSSGNVYVADTYNNAVKEMPPGCASASCVTALGTGFFHPAGIAVDGLANIYVGDTFNNAVDELNGAIPPSLSFANTAIGSQSSDSPQTVTLRNIGNSPLTFPVPMTGEDPSVSTNFALDSATTCPEVLTSSSAGTLAAGATCALAVDFIPTTAGWISGTAVLTDNNLNASNATQTILLNGTGLEPTVSVAIGTSPAGLSFSINGIPYSATQTPSLNIGTQYALATTSPQAGGPGVQYVFSQWSDGTMSLTDFLTPTAGTTSETAQFTAQYLLTVTAGAGGTIGAGTAPNGFYNPATLQSITATPNAGYYFTGWTGANSPSDIASATSATTTVTMNGPENLTANFAPIPGYQVTTLNDDATGNAANCTTPSSSCTLRDAITAAEANNGGVGNITFASGLTGTITLTSALPALSGQITIAGPGASSLTISGGNSQTVGSVFTVNSGATVAFSSITITGGNSDNGGGITNNGTTTITNSTISGNTGGCGGAICTLVGTLTLSGSTISGNNAQFNGGAIVNGSTLTVINSTISNNTAHYDYGGGIFNNNGVLTVLNSTLSGNTSDQYGGGIYNAGTVTVSNSIIAGNAASGNPGDDCDRCGTQSGYNLISTPSNIINPMLAALGNYGGPTQTMLPLPGSAAICAASSALIPAGVTMDQRGFPNSTSYNNTACSDLGAVQTNYALSFTTEPSSSGTVPGAAMSPAPAVTVTESGNALTGGSASVSVTDANSDLTATPAMASTTSGVAAFSSLIFTGATSSDTLTAALSLNPALTTPLAITALSTSFSVGAAMQSVTVGTSPAGLSFSINGTPYTTTQTPGLTIGTQYTLATTSPQTGGPGVQYVFSQWSDGTTSLTDLLTPTSGTNSDVADFTTQYLLTVTAGSGGTIGASTAPNGFYSAGTLQTITATPNAGYYFTGWTGANSAGDIASATSTSTTVTMNGPENLTANFAPIPGYVVTALTDDPPGNAADCPVANSPASSNCTLRDAILAADAGNGGMGAITFASGLTGTITLTSALPALSGQITITGPGASNLTISGGNSQTVGSIFTVNNLAVVGFSGITIANGNNATGSGGGIANAGTLTLSNSTVSGNSAPGNGGGGIYSSGTLVVSGSSISGNTAYYGAGIAARSGSVAVSSSTISGNASSYGAGIDFGGGGALTLTVVNSTIFGNTGSYGGGIHVYNGTVTVSSTTIYGNTGIQGGGGIYNQYGALTVNNSILAGDTPDECDYTACPSNGSSGNVVGVASNLAPLGNYGGPTQTLLPLPGSAAICAGSPSLVPAGVSTDQRGFARLNTSYTGYSGTTPCADVGAVQTNYAVSFTTDPPSMGTIAGTAMSPAPAVTVTESGSALTGGSASVSVTDANSDLTTSPATATTSTSNGQAAFSNLIFTGATSNDTLTASLALNPSITGLNLTTTSTSFSVAAAVPPAITSMNNTTFVVGALGSFTVKATGSPTPTLSETGTLPSGVSFNSTTGVLSGAPAAGTGGTYSITFTASNGTSPNAVQSFTLTVDQAPAITSAPSAVFILGTLGTFTLTATGFPAPTFSLTSGTLPSGVTFNAATHVLSGTPGAGTDGTYALQFTAGNGVGSNAVQNFTLTVGQVPAITSAAKTTFTVGTAGIFTMTATGYPAPTFSETGALPSGVTLSPAGVLSGTPAAGTGGVYSISVTASNAAGASAAQTFTLTVDEAPAITSAASTTFTTGTAGSFTVIATGYPAPTFTRAGTLPGGVTFAAATGVLSGTPGASAGGSYSLTFTAKNSVGTSTAQSFTLTVNQLPKITSAAKTTFTVGTAGTFTVTGTGYPAPTFSETGALPSGVTLSAAGVLSGTPAAGTGGVYSISVTASNAAGASAAQTFTLTVDQAPAITSAASTTFATGTAGSFTVTATGYPAPTFTKTGTLPTGVTFAAATGVLSGTPGASAGGSYSLTFTATNAAGTSAAQSFTLTVNQLPKVTSAVKTTFTVGTAGTFTMTASGYPAPTFSETGALPSGVTLSAAGVLSGTPAAGTGGVYSISVTASNAAGVSTAQTFTLTVDEAPAITSAASTTFTTGTAGSFTVTATGYPAPTFTRTGTLPTGVTFNTTTGVLSGTPSKTGTYTLTFKATNSVGTSAAQTFTLTVN
jgi:CSLREA domain-containing protein/uncharacterized repeat protein (TIGR02543 family)